MVPACIIRIDWEFELKLFDWTGKGWIAAIRCNVYLKCFWIPQCRALQVTDVALFHSSIVKLSSFISENYPTWSAVVPSRRRACEWSTTTRLTATDDKIGLSALLLDIPEMSFLQCVYPDVATSHGFLAVECLQYMCTMGGCVFVKFLLWYLCVTRETGKTSSIESDLMQCCSTSKKSLRFCECRDHWREMSTRAHGCLWNLNKRTPHQWYTGLKRVMSKAASQKVSMNEKIRRFCLVYWVEPALWADFRSENKKKNN